ncbi:carbamoyltransferase HypF [Phytoactinopolyspora limicola]|uniref:carbamoyltransferase HypF n=1 Tax=Phytoactinopolyspora limicola TaxID=2715536 RepID=UPI00140903DB|nr:carbamoyltransferase HypF [Phytoactinopolyspora limicola]
MRERATVAYPAQLAGRLGRIGQRFEVYGSVQGVGFRPHVVRLARELGLDGWVHNAGGLVVIEAAGNPAALSTLLRQLTADAPPNAAVSRVDVSHLDHATATTLQGRGFHVVGSIARAGPHEFPPDLATCDACLRELFDPSDRRYRYPFVNCTACGPRATIITELPYDRDRTTMAPFELCAECTAEYTDETDRRFHAEPVACPKCGPRLTWAIGDHGDRVLGDAALMAAAAAIDDGAIVAVKGLGGYQLVCDATQAATVQALRGRKGRPEKPLAVMVRDVTSARSIAHLDTADEKLLVSTARPIVLVTSASATTLAPGVHPGTHQVGVFLPYTPVHHLLLHELARPLVVTSGNRSDEPIAIDDADALARLSGLADGFLTHNRQIRARYDDSVTRTITGRPALVRRARGYAPSSMRLPHPTPQPLLATGAQQKHTFTVADGDRAVLSPHVGDLSDHDTFAAFEDTLAHLSRLVAIRPTVIAHDLHPGYLSTQYAQRWPAHRRIGVQHHHAHVASCAAEHGVTGPFLGVAYDGLGWGDDGTFWGGELLVADLTGYRRVGRFARAPLPGGEAAIRRPARMALGYLFGGEKLGGVAVEPGSVQAFTDRLPRREVDTVRRMVERGVNCPPASSAGRLFDAVSSLLGLCDDATYEGAAAVALESVAGDITADSLPWRLSRSGGLLVYDPGPTIAAVLDGVANRTPRAHLAAAFHTTIVEVTVAMCVDAGHSTGLRAVCLSGGVLQNRRLASVLLDQLRHQGFTVYLNEHVPANDGGVSYGQAAIAAARMGGA